VKPQAAAFLEKSRELLERADKMLGVGLNEDAGRTAYLAGFHAVQALIFEHRRRAVKTHKGYGQNFSVSPSRQYHPNRRTLALEDDG
jgi:uncharacterized protein (UPF0332 family)